MAKTVKGPSLTGTIVKEGHTITFTKIPPRLGYSNSKKERGLRTIHIDNVLRGYIIMPHGWGKYPVVQSIAQFKQGSSESTNVRKIYTDTTSEYCVDFTAEHLLYDLNANKLPTAEDIEAAQKSAEEQQKILQDEREKHRQMWIADGIDTVTKMRELQERLGNLITEEDKGLLRKVTVKLFSAYHNDVREHFEELDSK